MNKPNSLQAGDILRTYGISRSPGTKVACTYDAYCIDVVVLGKAPQDEAEQLLITKLISFTKAGEIDRISRLNFFKQKYLIWKWNIQNTFKRMKKNKR